MKLILTILFIGFCSSIYTYAGATQNKKPVKIPGLPFEQDTTEVKIKPVTRTKDVLLEMRLELPKTQDLNRGAPSEVGIYEKNDDEKTWSLSEKISLNSFPKIDDMIFFRRNFSLRSEKSNVAIVATVFHCGVDHKSPCYIQGYRGFVNRNSQSKRHEIEFAIKAHMK